MNAYISMSREMPFRLHMSGLIAPLWLIDQWLQPCFSLKAMADQFRQGVASSVICLVATDENKASCVVSVTDDLTATHNAVDLVRLASAALGGKGGGGRADMAQAGGPEAGQADAAIAAVRAALAG